ncbi:hypothetical protein [Nocardiopsis halotolerans]|uniref:hypothetical protein n=1 Tax=Nocardiopsis halotolerans TaxID=124252 RepID=UPI0004767F07|nr:hypothetical protein [Nocardiopsis halotolerans]
MSVTERTAAEHAGMPSAGPVRARAQPLDELTAGHGAPRPSAHAAHDDQRGHGGGDDEAARRPTGSRRTADPGCDWVH